MKNYRFDEEREFCIKDFDCSDTGEFESRHEAIAEFTHNLEKINEYQQKLFAEGKEGIIFVFQAMDAAGKDGAVRAVLSCLSPQGVSEHSFKVPSSVENKHDYLWRFWSALPEKGSISIFNRSYYEDVLVQKIHKIYEKNSYADRIDRDTMIDKRYEQIRSFEKYLWENSIRVVKIFLNVSKEEQARRFISRIDVQKKNWKFSSGDIDERAYWDEYMDAYETCINHTARKNSPWYVVPADHKWYARLVISRIVLGELKNMDPQWPVLPEDEVAKLQQYRDMLAKEIGLDENEAENGDVTDDGEKVKPSDTAVGIALKSDREALSEKKFSKLLENCISEKLNGLADISEETKAILASPYIEAEAEEAKAEGSDMDAVNSLYDEYKSELKAELDGHGKEAKKLYKHFKKDSKAQIEEFTDRINLSYGKYEDSVKQYMAQYEISKLNGIPEETALANYTSKMRSAYYAHRALVSTYRSECENKLNEIADKYAKLGMGFTSSADFDEMSEISTESND